MIAIKPHHFIDLIAAFGAGQETFDPHPYGHALHRVAARLWQDPEVMLRIELGADDICQPCSHNRDGQCDDTIDTSYRPAAPSLKREWNLLIDRRWCARLQLVQGDLLSAREFCLRLRPLADDLTEIYREIPPQRTAERAEKIRRGIALFLARV